MYLDDTHTCCTALELGGFREGYDYENFDEFKEDLRDAINGYDSDEINNTINWGEEGWMVSQIGLIVAFTTDQQPHANEYLKKLGFTSSPFFAKEKHPETKVAIHWINAEKLVDQIYS